MPAWTTACPTHQGKAKGLAACYLQAASPFGYLNVFAFQYCLIWVDVTKGAACFDCKMNLF
jgi:hypothetical protein